MKVQNLDRELIHAHLQLFRSLKSEMKPMGGITNLTLVQLNALIFLKEHEDAHVSDLSDYFGIAIPTATVLIDRLTSLKLVRREQDEEDRRVTKVLLTKKGSKLLEKAIRQREEILQRVFARLSTKDKNDFIRIMRNITQN